MSFLDTHIFCVIYVAIFLNIRVIISRKIIHALNAEQVLIIKHQQ